MTPPNEPSCVTFTLCLSFAIISSGGLLFGYNIGVNSNVVTSGQLICSDSTQVAGTWTSVGYNQCYNLSSWAIGVFSSMNLIGALTASVFCFKFGDALGRKREVQIASVFYILGSFSAAAAPTLWAVFLGLFIYGLGIGFAMHAAPIYIAEICPAHVRGAFVSGKEAMVVVGMVLGYGAGAVFALLGSNGWRYMLAFGGIIAVVMAFGAMSLHRSPRWLVLQALQLGRAFEPQAEYLQEARASLCFFRGDSAPQAVEQELQDILSDAAGVALQEVADWKETFHYPKPLLIGCGLTFLQQVTGQPSVLYNATNIFKSAGFADGAAWSSFGVGWVKLLATLATVWKVDDYGRKRLLFWGISMMIAALLSLCIAFLFRTCEVPGVSSADCPEDFVSLPKLWGFTAVAGMMLYVSGYQVGFGPIVWLMISEIFPLRVRGAAFSTAAVVNFLCNIIVNTTQSKLQDLLTPSGVYGVFLFMSIVSLWFVKDVVVETKGLTLEEIEREMTGRAEAAALLAKDSKSYGTSS